MAPEVAQLALRDPRQPSGRTSGSSPPPCPRPPATSSRSPRQRCHQRDGGLPWRGLARMQWE
eukprot:9403354-Alexandrium_andersonii.AAC.1